MYQPSQIILDNYANILVNFALNSGKGIKKNEVVRINASESAKPLFIAVRNAVLKAGAHPLSNYQPENDKHFSPSRDFFELANDEQLNFYPKKFMRGLIDQIDHTISIISTCNMQVLKGIDPAKIMANNKAFKPAWDLLDKKENNGKFTWTLGLYGTAEMAKEAGLSLEQYWQEIIKGCFLEEKDPIAKWKQIFSENEKIRQKLNNLKIDKIHVVSQDTDLWIKIGKSRKWNGGGGRNIPSFEIFTSPDWRETNGHISFNQPLYVFGNLIKNVSLEFKNGKVVKSFASQNHNVLAEMIKVKNADKIGEFSLTDGRFSNITKFMAETLYDENVGGPQGNTHIALGKSYHDCFDGNLKTMKKLNWKSLGFNDSAIHTDIVSTQKRTVTALLTNGQEIIIYDQGKFVI